MISFRLITALPSGFTSVITKKAIHLAVICDSAIVTVFVWFACEKPFTIDLCHSCVCSGSLIHCLLVHLLTYLPSSCVCLGSGETCFCCGGGCW